MKTLLITDSDFSTTDKNFNYLLWFQPSFGAMIIGKNKICIFLDSRYFWNTKNIDEDNLREKVWNKKLKIEYIKIEKTWLIELIIQNLKWKKQVQISDNIAVKYYNELKKSLSTEGFNPLNIVENIFWKKRIIKTSSELLDISKAIKIIDKVCEHILVLNNAGKLIWKTELQVRSIVISKIMEFWGSWESFDTIVAYGPNSAIPHHYAWETIIWEWVLLIDMWALYNWYCSDFTRTFWVWEKNKQSKEFQKIHNIVKQAHQKAFEQTRAGVTWEEVDKICRDYIDKAWYWEFFTHSTWHWVWLDIHEIPWVSKKQDNVLQDWMVFTIEPWIYLPWKFWVRLEDIVFMKNWKLEKMSKIEL